MTLNFSLRIDTMDSDEQAIRAVQTSWFQATMAGDLPRLLTLMADDVVFLTPGRPPFGRDEFATSFAGSLDKVRFTCEGTFEEVIVSGDVAYTRGRLNVTVHPLLGGDAKRLSGYTLSVYRKQPAGNWVLVRDANLLSAV